MVPYKERVLYLRVSSRIERIEGLRALSPRMVKTPNQETQLPLILDPGCKCKSYAWCHPRSLHRLGKKAHGYVGYVDEQCGQCSHGVGYAGYAPWVWPERRLACYYLQVC